jgi:hypothetical protein
VQLALDPSAGRIVELRELEAPKGSVRRDHRISVGPRHAGPSGLLDRLARAGGLP